MSTVYPDQNTGKEEAETSDLICKPMHMKNNAFINNKQQNCLTLQNKMSTQEVARTANLWRC